VNSPILTPQQNRELLDVVASYAKIRLALDHLRRELPPNILGHPVAMEALGNVKEDIASLDMWIDA
jgi:hypothetical protein